jgi:uncharacterized membrane protein
MQALAQWLGSTQLSQGIQRAIWLIALLQAIHILAIAMVLSSVAMIELRILGVTRSQSMTVTARRFMPWIWTGLVVLASTGIVLIIAEPKRTLDNNLAFDIKMLMLAAAIAVTLAFQASLSRHLVLWEDRPQKRKLLSAFAACTLVLWCAIAVAGRWIAYVRVE